MAFPWSALALGGASIFESLINKLFNQQPKEVRGLTTDVARKGRELIANPGYSDAVLEAIYGKNFQNIRGAEKNTRQATTEGFARSGMLGTGAERKTQKENAWQNEGLVSEALRDLLITGETKKAQSYQLATQMLGASSGAAQSQQGQGPALTEMLLNAMLLSKKKPALSSDSDWSSILGNTTGGNSYSGYSDVISRINPTSAAYAW